MANERKTENIVRRHFEQYREFIEIEEQISDSPKINKLLKSASKKAEGKGYPEFIISYKTNSNFIIVIECKADASKHESQNHDKYDKYSVDGALLYASYLSKEYDVLAIAVSGSSIDSLRISHFIQIKNELRATKIFGSELLNPTDYLNGYLNSPEKFRQDYYSLLEFAKRLNEKLHTFKIPESQRALLISSILIACRSQ